MLICQSFSLPVNPRFCSKTFFEVERSVDAMRVLAVLVMALSLLIFGSIGRSDAVPKTTFLSPVDGSNKKKSSSNMSPSSSSLEAVNTLFSNSSKNKNITLDEMRVVPTGPNPLHNR
ncbi:hypothetical protein NC652_040209 [Populus alba x Populus x berolinensis]|uniref:Uncharacterized protein n=1 Tax=Populus alba TaxID=43335 RepID=A0ACC4ALI2_POPAL|nr:hypothetical protein NC652_040209 [Populus alba x Populus x berolinensis]